MVIDNPYRISVAHEEMENQDCGIKMWIRKLRVVFIGSGALLGMLAGVPLLTRENALGFLPVFPGAIFGGLFVRWLSSSRKIGKAKSTVLFSWKMLVLLGCAASIALCIATLSKGYAIMMVFVIIGLSMLAGFYAAGIVQNTDTA